MGKLAGSETARGSAALEWRSLQYAIGGRTPFECLDLRLPAGESVAVMGPSARAQVGVRQPESAGHGPVQPLGGVDSGSRE